MLVSAGSLFLFSGKMLWVITLCRFSQDEQQASFSTTPKNVNGVHMRSVNAYGKYTYPHTLLSRS
jgi:hypothetical protein